MRGAQSAKSLPESTPKMAIRTTRPGLEDWQLTSSVEDYYSRDYDEYSPSPPREPLEPMKLDLYPPPNLPPISGYYPEDQNIKMSRKSKVRASQSDAVLIDFMGGGKYSETARKSGKLPLASDLTDLVENSYERAQQRPSFDTRADTLSFPQSGPKLRPSFGSQTRQSVLAPPRSGFQASHGQRQGASTIARTPRKLTTKEDAKFQCPVKGCGKLFGRSYNYKAHMETHDESREYPFPCPQKDCNKKFVSKTDLQRHHHIVHTKQRSYRCDYCNRYFARKDTLRRHMEDGCSKRFDIERVNFRPITHSMPERRQISLAEINCVRNHPSGKMLQASDEQIRNYVIRQQMNQERQQQVKNMQSQNHMAQIDKQTPRPGEPQPNLNVREANQPPPAPVPYKPYPSPTDLPAPEKFTVKSKPQIKDMTAHAHSSRKAFDTGKDSLCLHDTISRDLTHGEKACQASLLASFAKKSTSLSF